MEGTESHIGTKGFKEKNCREREGGKEDRGP
jgi:hypothetical protein